MVLYFFLKKGFCFSEIIFKVKVLKTFKICSDCHIKKIARQNMPKIPSIYRFLEEPMLFLLALK